MPDDGDWTQIGEISVDAGLCWVGDPCYVLGDDATSRVKDWNDFCDILNNGASKLGRRHDDDGYSEPLGLGVGFAIHTGYGDGSYPVEVKTDGGRIAAIRIEFIPEEDHDE